MLRGVFVLYVMVVFFLGFVTHAALQIETPTITSVVQPAVGRLELEKPIVLAPVEKLSPYDWIKERNVHLYEDKVVIDIDNPQWSTYTDTNSMDPVIDENSHGIQIIPKTSQDIHLGDIISYAPPDFDGILIHRVVSIGRDEFGWYAITQGDNNPYPDPDKVRFGQIRRVLVMIIY